MTRYRTDLTRGVPLPATWVNALMEFIGTHDSNFKLVQSSNTQLQIVAGTDNDQVAIAISGKWRFNTTTITATAPAGAAATYDAWVTGFANDLSAVDPLDNTNYAFGLQIRARVGGNPDPPPTATASSAISRRVGVVTWDGAKITGLQRLVGQGMDALTLNPWLTFPTGGSWSLGGVLQDAKYRKTSDNNYVEFRGVLEGTGTNWSAGSTLPTMLTGFRPVSQIGLPVTALEVTTTNRYSGILYIDNTGAMSVRGAPGGVPAGANVMRMFLDGIRYPLD